MAHEGKAEEILRKYCTGFDPILMNFTARDFKDRVLRAMFEYANYMIDLNKNHLHNKAIDACIQAVENSPGDMKLKNVLESLKIKP